nr:MAG TPA: hypothetical protein [Caudoviricetes sp.]
MNAIQYFEWGGGSSSFFGIRIKDFFTNPKGARISDLLEELINSKDSYTIRLAYSTETHINHNEIRFEKYETFRDGNDFVIRYFVKKNQWKDGNILVFQFNILPNNQNYFPQQEVNTATTYILGRKIKKYYQNRIIFQPNGIILYIQSGDYYKKESLKYEDGVPIDVNELYNKEITYILD